MSFLIVNKIAASAAAISAIARLLWPANNINVNVTVTYNSHNTQSATNAVVSQARKGSLYLVLDTKLDKEQKEVFVKIKDVLFLCGPVADVVSEEFDDLKELETEITPLVGAKQYFELSVAGQRLKIRYILHNEEFVEPKEDNRMAVAWLEEKDKNTHYFLFKLANAFYVLSAKHAALNGLATTLIKTTRDVNATNFRNVPRWQKNVERLGGNLSSNVHVYYNSILKTEGEPGKKVDIGLRINLYTENELGTIENPIVVEDV